MSILFLQKENCLSLLFCQFSFIYFYLLLPTNLDAQDKFWTPISADLLPKEETAKFHDFNLFTLDTSLFLSTTTDLTNAARQSTIQLSIPFDGRNFINLTFGSSPIIAEGLIAKFPSFQTYKLIETSKDLTNGRITWANGAFYGHFVLDGQSIFIENILIEGNRDTYILYKESDLKGTDTSLVCGNNLRKQLKDNKSFFQYPMTDSLLDTHLKIFEIAITATEGFTNASGGTKASALAAIIRALTSLNVIYEKDMGIRFVLHENNEQLIFTDSIPSPYTDAEDAFGLWEENPFILDSLLGNSSYDLGHVFAAECSGGVAGLASLANVCSVENKARAVSCVFDGNLGTFRATLYHEIGHQLGANHTWSNCGVIANEGQRSETTAVEPGSGSTIMSYGGVCGPFDIVSTIQNNLHGISIQEIKSAMLSDSIGCYELLPTENTPPIVSIRESGFAIPIATPFELDAIASDVDSTVLTYSWEQFDTGAVSQIGFPIENAPSFRAYAPVRASKRIFPRINDIILNKSSDVEVLPDTTRMLTFGVTVRDNDERGGSTVFSEVIFFASAEAGPFIVTFPDSANIEYASSDSITVMWNVANTDSAPINCSFVDVHLSFDNGKEFDYLLAKEIPNNGKTTLLLPDTTTTRARIKIKCSDNIFFDMSNNRFKITEPIISSIQQNHSAAIQLFPNPTKKALTIAFSERTDKEVTITIIDALGQIVKQKSVPSSITNFAISTDDLANGIYFLKGNLKEQLFLKKFIKNE